MSNKSRDKIIFWSIIILSITPLLSNVIKLFVLIIISFFVRSKIKIHPKLFYFNILFISTFLFSFFNDIIIGGSISNLTIGVPIFFICSMILASNITLKSFYDFLNKIGPTTTVISILIFGLLILFPTLQDFFIPYEFRNTEHKTIFIHNIITNVYGDGLVLRNAGIAWEPGVFQFLISLFFVASININKLSTSKLIIYSVGILTTLSTTGIINLLILLIVSRKKINKFMIYFLYTILIILFFEFTNIVYTYLDSKFLSYSFDQRFIPLKNSLNFVLENPLGIGNIAFDFYKLKYNLGAFDSIGMISVRYGLPTLFLYFYIFITLFKKNFVLGFIILTTLFTQSLWYTPILLLIIFLHLINFEKNHITT